MRLAVPLRHKVQSLHLNKNIVNTILGKRPLSKNKHIHPPAMCWWVKQPLDGRHGGRLLGLSCRESAVREGAPGTANLAGTKHFASKIGWEPRQKSPVSKRFLSCKLAVTADRMCSHCRLTVLQFSSAAHPKVHSFSCFSSVYRSFFVSFFVYPVTRRVCEYICMFLIIQNDLVAIPNDPLLLPPSALPKKACRYDVSDYIIQTGTRNLHVRSFTSARYYLSPPFWSP